jgi:hypothetical protein
VTTVSLARSTFSDQERVTVTASVANRTDRAGRGDSLTLEIGGARFRPAAQHAARGLRVVAFRAVHGAVAQHARDVRAGAMRSPPTTCSIS